MAKFTCPFCIREYNIKKVLYVCPDCNNTAKPKIFEHEPIKCKEPSCGRSATRRICPNCGNEIPRIALETPNLSFSIVGVSNSGKTNYITVMLHELSKAIELQLALGTQNKDTRNHQDNNYQLIYVKHTPPEGTLAGVSMPQIWYIKNLLKKSKKETPTYTFTIFDGAGEDHENNMDPASTVCRYINASKAIMLVLDPLILSNIRNGGIVDQDIMRNSLAGHLGETKNAVDIVNSLATYIKAARGISSNKILNIPVAVILTKFDTILSHRSFGPGAIIRNPSLTIRDGRVNLAEIQQIDAEIRNWLEQIDEGSFINALKANFSEFYFFGVSSYGSPPKSASELAKDIKPHRVLDPILWFFKNAKFID